MSLDNNSSSSSSPERLACPWHRSCCRSRRRRGVPCACRAPGGSPHGRSRSGRPICVSTQTTSRGCSPCGAEERWGAPGAPTVHPVRCTLYDAPCTVYPAPCTVHPLAARVLTYHLWFSRITLNIKITKFHWFVYNSN